MTGQPIAAVAAMALALAACSPAVDVHTQVAPAASRDRPRTVSVVPAAEYLGGRTPYELNPLLNDAATNLTLRNDLVRGLARRGYVVSDSMPDAMLVFYLAVPEEHDFTDADYDFVWRPAWWRGWGPGAADATQPEYIAGAIMIDLVDTRTGQVLYREHTVAPLAATERRYERALGRSVAAMLERLPAQDRGNG
jgi:hypothetical protein